MPHPIAVVAYEGWYHALILDLAGCETGVPDADALATAVPRAIAEYTAWLRRHGDALGADDAADGAFDVAERLDARDYAATGGGFLLDADRAPLSAAELERDLVRAGYAHADLAETLRGVPDAVLDHDPGDIALEQVDAWAPEARTVRGIVTHNSQLEIFYRGALRDGPAPGIFECAATPGEERARTLAALRALDDAARNRVYRPVHPGRSEPEPWTVRKTLRRLISHERHHTAEIRDRLARRPSPPPALPRGGKGTP